jgi:hypothetical protein
LDAREKELAEQMQTMEAVVAQERKITANSWQKLKEEEPQHQHAKQNLKDVRETLDRRIEELETAEEDAASIREQILNIRDKMKKARETGATKRSASSGGGGSTEKKLKAKH